MAINKRGTLETSRHLVLGPFANSVRDTKYHKQRKAALNGEAYTDFY